MNTVLTVTRPDGSELKFRPCKRDIGLFASLNYEAIVKFYEDPENMKRFEEWKKQRDKERRAAIRAAKKKEAQA